MHEPSADLDDPGSGVGTDDAAEPALNLSPRTGHLEAGAPRRARKRASPFVWGVLAVVIVGLGFVVVNGLSGATLYFRNADEALAERDDLGTRRFRLQGLVVDDAVTDGDVTTFEVAFNDAVVPVRSTVGLPALFQPGRPVVLEGHFAEGDDAVYLADHIFVKHDESYESDNPDRIADAEDGQGG